MRVVSLLPTMTSTKADFLFDLPRHTKVLLVLDVVESVRLMEGDEHGFVQRWQQFRERTKQLLQLHDGRMVKSLGDGLMLEFSNVRVPSRRPLRCRISAPQGTGSWSREADAPQDRRSCRRLCRR